MIIFSLIKTNFLRNNGLFKRNSTQGKGNRIIKMGRLFFTSSLNTLLILIAFIFITNILRYEPHAEPQCVEWLV